jgi:hypothetical protein
MEGHASLRLATLSRHACTAYPKIRITCQHHRSKHACTLGVHAPYVLKSYLLSCLLDARLPGGRGLVPHKHAWRTVHVCMCYIQACGGYMHLHALKKKVHAWRVRHLREDTSPIFYIQPDVGSLLDYKTGDPGLGGGGREQSSSTSSLPCILLFIHNHKIYEQAGRRAIILQDVRTWVKISLCSPYVLSKGIDAFNPWPNL